MIVSILERMKYKGAYLSKLRELEIWQYIIDSYEYPAQINDADILYLYLNPGVNLFCPSGNKKRYLSLQRGYGKYCTDKSCLICRDNKTNAAIQGVLDKYGVNNVGKLPQSIAARKDFWSDPNNVELWNGKRKITNNERYGCDNVFQNEDIKQRITEKCISLYGVDNVSKSDIIKERKRMTCFNNYGVNAALQSDEIKLKRRCNMLDQYGVEHSMQLAEVVNKMMNTKIKNGTLYRGGSSMEATTYFRNHVKLMGYNTDQVAYHDNDYGLHEWGYFFDRWYLFDFVAFERGFRGNKDKIIEIIEYNGPFHYTLQDVELRGDDQAYPWKDKTITIKESYNLDQRKEKYAKQLCNKYTVIWPERYHPNSSSKAIS